MKTPRHLPRHANDRNLTPVLFQGMIFAACMLAIWLVWSARINYLIYVVFFLVIAVQSSLHHRAVGRRLDQLASKRPDASICTFARSFDRKTVDTKVIRAVYEELQNMISTGGVYFPLLAEDRLEEDLGLDPDDIDLDLVAAVSEKTGRSLEGSEDNPFYAGIVTVRDFVMFVCAQPKASATV